MRRQTRPFTVKIKSRRKPTENSIPDTRWGRLIDDPAPDELPSCDVNGELPATVGDGTPFAATNRVFST